MSAVEEYERACDQRVAEATPSTYGATRIEYTAGAMHDELLARIADLDGIMDMMRENAVDREKRIAELEAKLAESNEMYKAAMALWAAETGRRKQGEAELAAAHEVISHFQQGCEP